MRSYAFVLGVLFVGGCFKVQIEDGHLQCSSESTCPNGYTCDKPSNLCYRDGETPNTDGGVDLAPLETDASTPGQLGHQCTVDGDCTNSGGHCVDGVCCNETKVQCGTCQACNIPGRLGFCSPVNSGQADPRGGCTADLPNCVTGGCNGSGACLAAIGTTCGTTCNNGADDHGQWDPAMATTSKCDGSSASSAACMQVSITACSNAGATCADAKSCQINCAKDADCAHGYYCGTSGASKICVARIVNGGTCTSDNQCASYICASGKCVQCDDNDDSLECPPSAPACINSVCTASCTPISSIWSGTCSGGTVTCAGNNANCKQGRAPNCNATTGACECGIADGATPCDVGQVCISSKCLVETAFPCVQNSDCASGTCTAGLCTMMTAGATCEAWDQDAHPDYSVDCGGAYCCVFGTCTPSMGSCD
jgi:hypothetical protein